MTEAVAPVVTIDSPNERPLKNFSEVPKEYWERIIPPDIEKLYIDLLREAKDFGDSDPFIRLQGSSLRAVFLTGYTPLGTSRFGVDPKYASDLDSAVSSGVMEAAKKKGLDVRQLNGFEVGKKEVAGRELGFVAVEDLRTQYETALKELKLCLERVREEHSGYTCEETRGTNFMEDSRRLLHMRQVLRRQFRGRALDVDVIERLASLRFETLGLNVTLSPEEELEVKLMDEHGLVAQSQRSSSLGLFSVANSVFQEESLSVMYLKCWRYIQKHPDIFSTYYPRWAMESIMRVLVVGAETGSFFQAQDSNPDYVLLRQTAELMFDGRFDRDGVAEARFWDDGTRSQLYRDMSRAFANEPLIAFRYIFEYMSLSWIFGRGFHKIFSDLYSPPMDDSHLRIESDLRSMMIRAYGGKRVDLYVTRESLFSEGAKTYKPETYPRSMNEIIALILVGLHEHYGDELEVERIIDEIVASWPDSVDDRIPFYWAVGSAERSDYFDCGVTKDGIIEEIERFEKDRGKRYAAVRQYVETID